MSRSSVCLRQATVNDVPFLVELWDGALRRADRQEQVHDLEIIVKDAAASAEQRLLVADYDGEPAGAVFLEVTTLTALNREPTLHALAPYVSPSFRRKGIGRVLMEAAVSWAEELGIGHVKTSAAASSRSGNRFMARLSLGPRAVLRSSPTHAVRAQLTALQPASQRIAGRRPLGQVLAVRRQLSRRVPEGSAETP
jgi:GNAT superfamily N-acetyltransferase